MVAALIFVDNLRIGGIQRLALDEAYGLSDQGVDCTIITLENSSDQTPEVRYLSTIESGLIEEKKIQVRVLSSNRVDLFRNLNVLLRKSDSLPLIISHSLRSTFVLKLIKLTSPGVNFTINTKIHQIPSLVDRKQRFKRFMYAQFSDELFCFSEAVRVSWGMQFGRSFSRLMKLSKEIVLLRNGIYLPRLPKILSRSQEANSNPRLIFLGRLTFWKGVEILEILARESALLKFDFLFVVPSNDENSLRVISGILGGRMKIITGKSVSDLELYSGDIHLYPTQYGENSLITESISLNCLEMAGVGIPSIITSGGQHTWGEQEFAEVFFEVDWQNISQVVTQISRASNFTMNQELHSRLMQLMSIDNEIVALQNKYI